MVSQKAFDELAQNATTYIQKALDRIAALEARVEALEAKKTVSRKTEASK